MIKKFFKSSFFGSIDWILFFLMVGLIIFGITLVGSATQINVTETWSSEYKAQITWAFLSIIPFLIVLALDYNFVLSMYMLVYLFNLLLLVLVLVAGVDDTAGVKRWLMIPGTGTSIQPSEFTKLFMIIFLAKFLEINSENVNKPRFLAIFSILVLTPILLIAKQPSLTSCIVPLLISVIMLFVAGLDTRVVLWVAGIGLVVAVLVVLDSIRDNPLIVDHILRDYQVDRIRLAVLKEGQTADYSQTGYSIQAIGSGQLFGKGLYHGTVNQLDFLPESHNDFVFSVLGEEFGFLGTTLTILAFSLLIFRIFQIAKNSKNMCGSLLCTGVGSMMFIQVFINIGVNTGLLPNTGMTLPFLSYGGSSLMINIIAIALVMSVGMTKGQLFKGE